MRKSTVIATCLVNFSIINRMDDAENAVRDVFAAEFPTKIFARWNVELDAKAADHIIKTVGRASRIKVRKLIEDLG
jgi:hypothetical protein